MIIDNIVKYDLKQEQGLFECLIKMSGCMFCVLLGQQVKGVSAGMLCMCGAVLRNASPPAARYSSVFLMHRSAAGRPRPHCARRKIRMFLPVHTRRVYRSCSPLLPWQRRAHGSGNSTCPALAESCCRKPVSLLEVEKHIHARRRRWRQTDRLRDRR